MLSLNEVTLIGYVGRDPKSFKDKFGKTSVFFSLCTTENWKNKDGSSNEKNEWHNISVKNDALSDLVMNYVKKGSYLFVKGRIESFEKKDEPNNRVYQISLSRFDSKLIILNTKNSDQQSYNSGQQTSTDFLTDDEVPF